MVETSTFAVRRLTGVAFWVGALLCAAPALAQDGEPRPKVSDASPKSSNATINLVNLLVKNGVLTADQAQGLIKQAEDEAYVARQAARDASAKAEEAGRQAAGAAAAASPPGAKRVTYVPELVKRQIRDEIRAEVMSKAEKEGWASPGKYPEWASRIRFKGDLRGRYENIGYPKGNDPRFVNFAGINQGSPYDLSVQSNPFDAPYFNSDKDRQRYRLRARIGMEADVAKDVQAGFRIATGENNSPVSTNQSFGANGGNFSKYALWLDRAYLSWDFLTDEASPDDALVSKAPIEASRRSATLLGGRFDSPFWAPTEMQWDSDLGFDGVAVKGDYEIRESLRPFFAAGAFPIFNTDLNAGFNLDVVNNAPSKSKSEDRYLFGGQIGVDVKPTEAYAFRFAGSYFDFSNVRGKRSSPCLVSSDEDVCDTDLTRPLFAQKGNTYRALRDLRPGDPANPDINQFQYFGLASNYRTVSLAGQFDFAAFDPVHVVLDGEYIKNVAFNKRAVGRIAENNRGPLKENGDPGDFEGGDTGWTARLTVGYKEIKKKWDWNAHVGYRYLESDATLDAFTDSDFGLGGANLKGYMLGGNLGLADNVWTTARWMSADNVAGQRYSVDIFQLDVNARF